MRIIPYFYHKFVSLSPYIEIMMRKLYWSNVKLFQKYKIGNHVSLPDQNPDFYKIEKCLKDNGVKDSDIMVIHSAFSPFKNCYSGEDIINRLLSVVPNGTIAMPAIRHYPEDEPYINYINQSFNGKVSTYDVNKTKITSGYLPFLMTSDKRAVISRCPHNPLVAIGKDAEEMMKGNIENDFITAHGKGSCWEYCVKKDAWNIGLGIPIEGFLTIFHWVQENGSWPVRGWFFPRKFHVKDGPCEKDIIFNERIHKWTKFYAETNFNNDMISEGVIKCFKIDEVPILMTKTSVLLDFIENKMKRYPTYPYFIPKKELDQYPF